MFATIFPLRRQALLAEPSYPDTKDPCPVHDGEQWHIFGSGGSNTSEPGTRQRVFFALADRVWGPYTTVGPVLDAIEGDDWQPGEPGTQPR